MVLLLLSILAHQYVSCASVAHADVLWLCDDDPNEPTEPEPEFGAAGRGLWLLDDDPNEPQPEMIGWAFGQSRLDDDPNEPQPEMIGWAFGLSCSDDDPNEPSDPEPEFA